MTILADTASWNSIITNVLLVVHVVVCILLCLVVMMQRPKQEGLGAAFGGGMTDQAFGARTTDVLQKGTVYLASILFLVTLILSILVGTKSRDSSITEELESSGAAAIEDNGDAAAALLDDMEEDLSADAIADAVKKATGEEGAADTETEGETPTPVDPKPADPANPEAPVEPAKPEAPTDPAASDQ